MTSGEKRIHFGYCINSAIIFMLVEMLTSWELTFFKEKLQIEIQQNEL